MAESNDQPLLSVYTITYNHGAYIRQCIEGVLMQETNFKYEQVIGEDCSTDNTREIVLEYAGKYPERIKAITSETNVGPKGNGMRTMAACRGKYIAICEGDDYWTDPLKLQKQVDFLEEHADYSMSCHASKIIVEGDETKTEIDRAADSDRTFTIEDFLEPMSKNFIRTESVVFRRSLLQLKEVPDWLRKMAVGDYPAFLLLAYHGKIRYIDQVMSVYRKHSGGIWTSNIGNREYMEKYFLSINEMYQGFDEYSNHIFHEKIQKHLAYRYFHYLIANKIPIDIGSSRKYFLKYWYQLPFSWQRRIASRLYLRPSIKWIRNRLFSRQ